MTPNEKDAHTAAYDATLRLRWTNDKTYRIYVAAKAEFNEAEREFAEAYEKIYQTTLADLEAKDDA
jgi:hypothetical protein